MKQYQTISHPSEGLYKDKGSRFLAFAEPVQTVEEVRARVEYYRKRYHDARHCCYAYVLGYGTGDNTGCMGTEYRANDDGEPSGTAGRPILGQINSRELTDILVVVVRYFGGILLGTGGLTVAYKEATRDALDHAECVTREVLQRQTLTCEYARLDSVLRDIRNRGGRIVNQGYTEDGLCCLTVDLPEDS